MDDTPQRTPGPLKFHRSVVAEGGYFADDDTKRYHVIPDGRVWLLEIRELITTDGYPHTNGQPVIDYSQHDTKGVCVAVANGFCALGDGYKPHEHGNRSRLTEAIRAYDGPPRAMGGRVTPVQRAALATINDDPYAAGVKGVTLDALERHGLTTPNHDHATLRWYLTDAGRTLLPAAVGAPDATPHHAATTQEQTPMTTTPDPARFELRTADNGDAIVWDNPLNRGALTLFPSDDSAYCLDVMNRDTRATASLVDGIAVHTLHLPHERAAYPFAQSNHAVHDGDVLVHGDLVAILIDVAYPCAISVQDKGCPRLQADRSWLTTAGGRYAAAYRVAVKIAGWVNIPLMQPVETETPVEPVQTPAADTPRYSVREAEQGEHGVWDTVLSRFATTGYGPDDAEFWRGELSHDRGDTAELIDGIAVHTLETDNGAAAYAFTQSADQFHDGDVLAFGGDVVAIMYRAWPCAITVEHRGFHDGLAEGRSWLTLDDGRYAAAYRVAVAVARDRGLPLREPVEGENGDDVSPGSPAPAVSLVPDVDGIKAGIQAFLVDQEEPPYQAAGREQQAAGRVARCEAFAHRGTGSGTCGEVLDQYGQCPRAGDHRDSATGGEL